LAVFRATAVAWTTVKYPAQASDLASAARASGTFATIGFASRVPAAALVCRAAVCASDAVSGTVLGVSAGTGMAAKASTTLFSSARA
jgi:hypothetical protein